MSEYQEIAKGLLGLTHPEVFASIGKRDRAESEPVQPAKQRANVFGALIASLGRGAWLL